MKNTDEIKRSDAIVYSCYYQKSWEGEQFVQDHVLNYLISGSSVLNDGVNEYICGEGSVQLIPRNQLMKFVKYPPREGDFQSLSIYLDQQILKKFCFEYDMSATHRLYDKPIVSIPANPLLKAYMDSLLAYHHNGNLNEGKLIGLKQKEGIMLLIHLKPELKNILFDFNEPHRIDLEAFMNKNYHFNVHLDRFAYLTGRSLATFKRDFEKQFNITPGRWIQQKRLKQAHYLISEKGKLASDIYLDLGFADLSHFSYAFKKAYGEGPSKISRHNV
ncbi:AraC family transcriptional regulator [Dyadobacter sp. CY345]|uniref:helix-turn-helix domain-containing protein n=1 Tax=Dyadobacter sp. CY345 TaxID=2909335 RepID=UPI001F34DF76|nr:AraC family transcriptional regulator [Dyadobacter sp. CY345]MCF2443944.1 AraC family transcriptional regulator [Dyadobacter sp. CY345]